MSTMVCLSIPGHKYVTTHMKMAHNIKLFKQVIDIMDGYGLVTKHIVNASQRRQGHAVLAKIVLVIKESGRICNTHFNEG